MSIAKAGDHCAAGFRSLRAHNFERAAAFVDKIFKGANPAELQEGAKRLETVNHVFIEFSAYRADGLVFVYDASSVTNSVRTAAFGGNRDGNWSVPRRAFTRGAKVEAAVRYSSGSGSLMTAGPSSSSCLSLCFSSSSSSSSCLSLCFSSSSSSSSSSLSSRRQRVVNDCDEAPVDQPGGNVFNGRSHVGSCRMSRHSWTDVSSRTGRRERGPGSARSRENPAQAWGATRPSAARSKKVGAFSALGGGFLRWATSTRDETSYSLRCRPTQRMF